MSQTPHAQPSTGPGVSAARVRYPTGALTAALVVLALILTLASWKSSEQVSTYHLAGNMVVSQHAQAKTSATMQGIVPLGNAISSNAPPPPPSSTQRLKHTQRQDTQRERVSLYDDPKSSSKSVPPSEILGNPGLAWISKTYTTYGLTLGALAIAILVIIQKNLFPSQHPYMAMMALGDTPIGPPKGAKEPLEKLEQGLGKRELLLPNESLGRRQAVLSGLVGLASVASASRAEAVNAKWGGLVPIPAPEPIRFPRAQLKQRFAVMLMRSGYESVDDLDFMSMADFQKNFWRLRRDEFEAYRDQQGERKGSIWLGELGDPLYFDFISFIQYSTIANEMPRGRMLFKEPCNGQEGCPEDGMRIIRRDPNLQNKQLPDAMEVQVGDKIYGRLVDGFEDIQFNGPPPLPESAGFEDMITGVRRIVSIFVENGYAIRGQVLDVKPAPGNGRGGTFCIRMEAPCNLWGIQRLGTMRAPLVNAFDGMAVSGYLRASGYTFSYALSLAGSAIETRWTVR